MKRTITTLFLFASFFAIGQKNDIKIEKLSNEIEKKVIKWRRHLHENPELSNREFNTAKYIAKHLKKLGIKVQEGVAKTGVVGILSGKKTGKVVALRADIDALPVIERNNLSFKSTKTTTYLGKKVGIMHACGHDTHIAILMGTAEVLSQMKNQINGTVKFIFQPAEEGAPRGEEGGAELMVKEGALKNPSVDVIFGLHISSATPVGHIAYRKGGIMAASQGFKINVKGKQSHGSRPWGGIDPIMVSAKIIDGLQTIISREADLTNEAAVITVGKIDSGVRGNIIPETAEMIGTIRTLDYKMQKQINNRMKEMVPAIAKAYKATATIEIEKGYPITFNNHPLVDTMLPTLKKVAGEKNVHDINAVTGAEDFSFFAKEIPGFYFFLGGKTLGNTNPYPHHTPDFFIDEKGMLLGVKAMTNLTLDYLNQ